MLNLRLHVDFVILAGRHLVLWGKKCVWFVQHFTQAGWFTIWASMRKLCIFVLSDWIMLTATSFHVCFLTWVLSNDSFWWFFSSASFYACNFKWVFTRQSSPVIFRVRISLLLYSCCLNFVKWLFLVILLKWVFLRVYFHMNIHTCVFSSESSCADLTSFVPVLSSQVTLSGESSQVNLLTHVFPPEFSFVSCLQWLFLCSGYFCCTCAVPSQILLLNDSFFMCVVFSSGSCHACFFLCLFTLESSPVFLLCRFHFCRTCVFHANSCFEFVSCLRDFSDMNLFEIITSGEICQVNFSRVNLHVIFQTRVFSSDSCRADSSTLFVLLHPKSYCRY